MRSHAKLVDSASSAAEERVFSKHCSTRSAMEFVLAGTSLAQIFCALGTMLMLAVAPGNAAEVTELEWIPVVRETGAKPCSRGKLRVFLDTAVRDDSLNRGAVPRIPRRSSHKDTLFALNSDEVRLDRNPAQGMFVIGGFRFTDSIIARRAEAFLPEHEWKRNREGDWGETPFELRLTRIVPKSEVQRLSALLESRQLRAQPVFEPSEAYLSIGRCLDAQSANSLVKDFRKVKTFVTSFRIDARDL